jgi:hypothetical protein
LVIFEVVERHDAACCANGGDGVIGSECEQVIMNRKAGYSHTEFPLVESISSILGDFFKRAFRVSDSQRKDERILPTLHIVFWSLCLQPLPEYLNKVRARKALCIFTHHSAQNRLPTEYL